MFSLAPSKALKALVFALLFAVSLSGCGRDPVTTQSAPPQARGYVGPRVASIAHYYNFYFFYDCLLNGRSIFDGRGRMFTYTDTIVLPRTSPTPSHLGSLSNARKELAKQCGRGNALMYLELREISFSWTYSFKILN